MAAEPVLRRAGVEGVFDQVAGAGEQPEPVREIQRRIKELFDPEGILNPGKAI